MGVSTNAILFYGYHFPEDYEMDEDVLELWGKKHKVLVSSHCSSDYPMYYVYIQESQISASSRGHAEKIGRKQLDRIIIPVWLDELVNFAREHNLPLPNTEINEWGSKTSEISWWLVSYWG